MDAFAEPKSAAELTVRITGERAAFVSAELAAGGYADADAVVRAALIALQAARVAEAAKEARYRALVHRSGRPRRGCPRRRRARVAGRSRPRPSSRARLRALDVTPAASADIDALLAWSESRFGPRTADRSRRMIEVAFDGLRENPERPGVRRDPAFPDGLRLYARRHCRMRLPPSDRIGRPRHVLAFRADAEAVVILRVLDERSDLPARLLE